MILSSGPNYYPTVTGQAQWYCIRSQPRRDHIAAANLRRHAHVEIFTPRVRFRRSTKRGLVWGTEALFPNYIFARFDRQLLSSEVRHTFGVAGIVHFGVFWPTVPATAIEELRTAVGEDETCFVEPSLEQGSEVWIAGGAFAGFRAVVRRYMPARQRVAVLLDFLGKQTVVEMDSHAVASGAGWPERRPGSAAAARLALK